MGQKFSQYLTIFCLLAFTAIAGFLSYTLFSKSSVPQFDQKTIAPVETAPPTPTIAFSDYITYSGKFGKSALDLLKENYSVGLDMSASVVSINGRKADPTKNEFWNFYVDGKIASTSAGDYQTNDSEKIEWRIERY